MSEVVLEPVADSVPVPVSEAGPDHEAAFSVALGVDALSGPFGPNPGKRAELVEDLDQLVVLAGLGQQLGGRGQRLACPGRGAEPCPRVRLQQRGHDLPQRLGDALGSGRRAVLREVLDQGLGIGSGPFEQVQGRPALRRTDRRKSGSAPIICSGAK